MIISLDNLRAGLRWWDKNEWGKDILNATYYDIYAVRPARITKEWWTATVNRLWDWKAIRSPKPPNTKADIAARGVSCLSAIADQYAKLVEKSTTEPNIADLCWVDVGPLFALASGIKPVKTESPVFPSKMCHFLFPKLFIPRDNTATGICRDYGRWWQDMKNEWGSFKDKGEATKILKKAVGPDLHPLYPLETKIMELSQIGLHHR